MERLNAKSFRYQRAAILFCIVVLALVVRIIGIDRESFWLDEGVSALRAFENAADIWWQNTARNDNNPPLFYYLLHYWIKVAGTTEAAMRLLSAIFSTLSVWLIYRVGKEVVSRTAAIFAALLTALSCYQLQYAQELRVYAFLGFISLLSLLFLLKLCRRYRHRDAAGYILATALMLYAHPYAVFQLVFQNIFFLLGRLFYRDRVHIKWLQWFGLQGLSVFLFVPWLLEMLCIVVKVDQYRPIQWVPRWIDLPGSIKTFAGDNAVGGFFLIILILWGVVETTGIFEKQKAEKKIVSFLKLPADKLFLLLWMICPILIPYLISQFSTPIFNGRYIIAASFACYLLAADGLMRIRPILPRSLSAVLLVGLFLFATIPSYSRIQKEQWREAVSYIEQRAQAGDVLLFHSGYCQECIYWYYAKRQDLIMMGFPVTDKDSRVILETDIRQQIPLLIDGRDRVWLILAHSFDKDGAILHYLREQYDIHEQKTFLRIEIYGLQKRR